MKLRTNKERAANARKAVRAHAELVRNQDEPLETQVTDLMVDLYHLMDQKGIKIEDMEWRVRNHFTAEKGPHEWVP